MIFKEGGGRGYPGLQMGTKSMFTMLKSGWSTLLRGDTAATKNELKSERISSDDGFFMIPTRKRSHVGNIYNMTTTGDLKVKKEKPPSPTSESDAGSMHVRFASATEDATSTVSLLKYRGHVVLFSNEFPFRNSVDYINKVLIDTKAMQFPDSLGMYRSNLGR